MSFSKIIGQNKAVATLANDLASGRVAESYLFTGPQGVGRRTAALELAKAVNCQGEKSEPSSGELSFDFETGPAPTAKLAGDACDQCASCRKVDDGTHPDIFTLDFESQARLLELDDDKIKTQRDLSIKAIRILIQTAYLTPVEGKKRMIIIDGAELLSLEAANALLKVLEESPPHCLWILLATSAGRMISTIRSRCRKVTFSPLSPQEIESLIGAAMERKSHGKTKRAKTEEEGISKTVISGTAMICGGSLAAALSLLDPDSIELQEIAESILHPVHPIDPLKISAEILADKRERKKRAQQFLKILSLKMAHDLRREPKPETAERLSLALQSQEEIHRNVSPQTVLDSLLLSFSVS